MNKKYDDLIQRIGLIHETWFLQKAGPSWGPPTYRILNRKGGKPLFEDFRTISEVNSWLDGYEVGFNRGMSENL